MDDEMGTLSMDWMTVSSNSEIIRDDGEMRTIGGEGAMEIVRRTAAGMAIKRMSSEPSGLGARVAEKSVKQRNSPMDNYSVLEEIGDSGYGKLYKVKSVSDGEIYSLKCLSYRMQRRYVDDVAGINDKDAMALGEFVRELLAHYRLNVHPNFLTMHDCWFSLYDLNDTPSTPSLGQPFDLDRFCLNRFPNIEPQHGADGFEEEELIDFQLYGKRLFKAVSKEHPLRKGKRSNSEGDSTVVMVLYILLDHCQDDLERYLILRPEDNRNHFPQGASKWGLINGLINICLALYDCDLLHLDLHPGRIGLAGSETNTCEPRLMDFGVNRYFQANLLAISDDVMQQSVYQAPEIALSRISTEHTVSWPADVYSLGLILVRILIGDGPEEKSIGEGAQGSDNIAAVLDKLSNIPADLKQLLKKILHSDPEDRLNPWELYQALAPFLDVQVPVFMLIASRNAEVDIGRTCQLMLLAEMRLLKARFRFRNWLRTVPNTMWQSVLQSCAKEMLERYLDHLIDLDIDRTDDFPFNAVSASVFDTNFILNRTETSKEMEKCMDSNTQLCKATIWYCYKKYAHTKECVGNCSDGHAESSHNSVCWVREIETLYHSIFGRSG